MRQRENNLLSKPIILTMQPNNDFQDFSAEVSLMKELTYDVKQISFKLIKPRKIDFKAGQFISLKVPQVGADHIYRAYSVASPPHQKTSIDLLVKIMPDGTASKYLGQLKVGDKISFRGPFGQFVFSGQKQNLLFVGTGTGIAPFYSMINELLHAGDKRKITLFFGLRHVKDQFYLEELQRMEKDHTNFHFQIILSQPEDLWVGPVGHVTDLVKGLKNLQDLEVYMCGSADMVEEVRAILVKGGVAEGDLHFEKY